MNAHELEAPAPLRRPGDTDAVTFSWVDAARGVCGLVRVATGLTAAGETQPSTLAIAFAGRETLGVIAEAGEAGTATVEAPLEAWTVRAAGELELELSFTALTPAAEYGGRDKVTRAGGLEGYEQLCAVRGTVAGRPVDGVGQRGHSWGNPDWDSIALTRAVGAWFADGTGIALQSIRSVKDKHHADEAVWATSFDPERAVSVEDPRFSTTYDEAGRQIRAGLELWVSEDDDYALRAAGEVLAGSTLELGALRLDCAFFRWHADGRTAVGRYDIIRRS